MSRAGILARPAYASGDGVIPVAGAFVGFEGEVDEFDPADAKKPYRVRFDALEGEPVAWYAEADLMPAPKRELVYSWKRPAAGGAR